MDAILRECLEAYHSINTQAGGTAPSKIQKELTQLANALPPASQPRFGEKMRQLNDYLDEWQKAKQKSAQTAVHRAIVQGRQLKSSIQKHLQPPDQAPISLRRSDGTLATDTKEVAKIFSDTLLHLGGSPDYTPPDDFTERLLSHTPQCPPGTETQDIPDMTWSEFTDILHSANPRKAGGDDHTNTYLLSALPPHLQTLFSLGVRFSFALREKA